MKVFATIFLISFSQLLAGQITTDPSYTFEQSKGTYCKVPLIKWVTPTVQAVQDRFDLEDFNIDLDQNKWIKILNNVSEENLSYAFYYPIESNSKLKPLIIFTHGGGFLVGGRESRSITFLCKEFAQRGYATASIEYRLKAINTFDMVEAGYMAMQDGNAAIKYFRANSKKYGIDPDMIFIAGISAGAVLALHSGHYEKGEDILGQASKLDNALGCHDCTGDYVTVSNKVTGVINIVGATTSPDILNTNLPTLHLYCPTDSVVPALSGIPLNNMARGGFAGNLFNPIISRIKRPIVYGPLHFKTLNLNKHTYIDASTYSNGICNHNIFMAENGVVKSSGKESIIRISKWINSLIKPSFSFPQRKVSQNKWTTYNLPKNIVSHSFVPNNNVTYKKINNNTFQVKPLTSGFSTFSINAADDLGLTGTSTIEINTNKKSIQQEKKGQKNNFNNYVIGGLFSLTLLIVIMIIIRKLL